MSVRDEVEALNSGFSKAMSNQDADAVTEFYALDAIVLPPGAPLVRGKTDIRALNQAMFDGGVRGVELESLALEVSDELVVEVGRFRLTMAPAGSEAVTDEGKYISVIKRQPDGTLRYLYDMFNSDSAGPS